MLPSINKGIKSYVWFFRKKFEKTTPPYDICMLSNQKLKITIPPIQDGPYKKAYYIYGNSLILILLRPL